MELLILWALFALIVGYAATQKGRSFAGWALLSFLISPLIALILLVVKGNAKPATLAAPLGGGSVADEIGKLATLRESGALSTEEFERQKGALLVRGPNPGPPAGWGSS